MFIRLEIILERKMDQNFKRNNYFRHKMLNLKNKSFNQKNIIHNRLK